MSAAFPSRAPRGAGPRRRRVARNIALVSASAFAVCLSPLRSDAAGTTLLGGFQPVAIEEGARAAWINPAEIAASGDTELLVEGVFLETPDGFGDLSFLTLAASAPGRAFGWQLELDDLTGIADWTLVAAHVLGQGHRARLGTSVEWRGGEERHFDAIVGAFIPLGSKLRAAAAVEDLFESDIDGVSTNRSWRGGVAARGRMGYLSWDWRGQEHETGRHILGAELDAKYLRLAGSWDDEGTWTAALRLVAGERSGGGGLTEPDEGFGSRFATIEVAASPRRVR